MKCFHFVCQSKKKKKKLGYMEIWIFLLLHVQFVCIFVEETF